MRKLKVVFAIAMIFCMLGGSFSYKLEAKASEISKGNIVTPMSTICPSCGLGQLTVKFEYGPWYYTGIYDPECPNHGAIHIRKKYERTVDSYKACTHCDFGYYESSWIQITYGHPNL